MVTASEVEAKLKDKLDAADVVGARTACVCNGYQQDAYMLKYLTHV
jgi:hypothetical protein